MVMNSQERIDLNFGEFLLFLCVYNEHFVTYFRSCIWTLFRKRQWLFQLDISHRWLNDNFQSMYQMDR